ncbi:MAG: hypothetical protein R2754_06710 [Microthrixaceae bacterium]
MSTAETPATDCDNCGAPGAATDRVRRVYVDPEAPNDPERATVTDEPELWCSSCSANYPHLQVEA